MPLFEELDTSPQATFEHNNGTGRREFLVFWSDINAFVVDALGAGGMSGLYPAVFPGFPGIFAKKVSLRPASDLISTPATENDLEGGTNAYSMVVMTVDYAATQTSGGGDATSQVQTPSGTFLESELDIGGQMFQPPARSFNWISGAEIQPDEPPSPDVNSGVFIPETAITLTWYNVEVPPLSYIRQARGKVNSTSIFNAYKEQILFLGAKWQVGLDINGTAKYNLRYFFKEKTPVSTSSAATSAAPYQYGWNHFWSPKANANGEHWFRTYPLAYKSIDMLPLFQYGP